MPRRPAPSQAPQTDRTLRAMTDDGAFRVMTIRATDTVRAALAAQQAENIPAVQLGEAILSAVLVRETMAPPYRVQVLLRDSDGNTVVGDAFPDGDTRGLVRVDDDVLGVPPGDTRFLQVTRTLPRRAPHEGIVAVPPGHEIERALTRYFRESEQIETRVALACVIEDGELRAAGGYVVQLLPEVTDPPLEALDARLQALDGLHDEIVASDADPRWLLETVLRGVDYTGLDESPVQFRCRCDDGRAIDAVSTLGEDELRAMLDAGETVEITCDYCRTVYEAGPADFRRLLGDG